MFLCLTESSMRYSHQTQSDVKVKVCLLPHRLIGSDTAVRHCLIVYRARKPIAHWRRFKIRRQKSAPGDSAGRATGTRCQRLHSHTSNTRTYTKFSARCSIYGKVSRRKDKSSKRLHPASLPIKTIIWWCLAAGVDAAMLKSEEQAHKKRGKVRS